MKPFIKTILTCAAAIFIQTSQAQNPDVAIGTEYDLNLQRKNNHGDAFILHNAEYFSGDDTFKWSNTAHASFGMRGIRFSYHSGRGIYFYADDRPTSTGTFTPYTRFFIGNNGNIGISTVAPQTKFQIMDGLAGGSPSGTSPDKGLLISGNDTGGALNLGIDATGNFYSWIQSRNRNSTNVYDLALNPLGGKVGIGLSAPAGSLHVKSVGTNNVVIESTGTGTRYTQLQFSDNGTARGYVWVVPDGNVMSIGKGGHQHINMRLDNDRVGIGTTDPDAKLTVKGDIHTNEVRVDMDPRVVPDYVFEKNYNLLPLSELEAYVNQNKHLPEVPSAKEMEENGLNLKEMNLLLLKKVEELTLHLIEQNKKDQLQQSQIDKLKEENVSLQLQINNILKN